MENSSGERLLRLPIFDKKSKLFMIWWIRFRAYATFNKFMESLKAEDETHLPASEAEVLVETVPAEALQIAARKRNTVAIANFAMSFTDETTMGMIYKAISQDWPTGKASVVVTELLRKFKPEDTMTRVERCSLSRSARLRTDTIQLDKSVKMT